jgi:hypothetical protein
VKSFTGSEISTPEEAAAVRKRLQAMRLPAQLQCEGRGKR